MYLHHLRTCKQFWHCSIGQIKSCQTHSSIYSMRQGRNNILTSWFYPLVRASEGMKTPHVQIWCLLHPYVVRAHAQGRASHANHCCNLSLRTALVSFRAPSCGGFVGPGFVSMTMLLTPKYGSRNTYGQVRSLAEWASLGGESFKKIRSAINIVCLFPGPQNNSPWKLSKANGTAFLKKLVSSTVPVPYSSLRTRSLDIQARSLQPL